MLRSCADEEIKIRHDAPQKFGRRSRRSRLQHVQQARLAELFVAGGMAEGAARTMATVTIAATEGAVVLFRAEQSRAPFDEVASTLTELIRGQS